MRGAPPSSSVREEAPRSAAEIEHRARGPSGQLPVEVEILGQLVVLEVVELSQPILIRRLGGEDVGAHALTAL